MNGVCWDFGIRFLPANPEDHKSVGGDGGGGVQGFTQPALRSTLVHFNCYLQSGTEKSKEEIQIIKVIKPERLQVAKNTRCGSWTFLGVMTLTETS